MPLHSTPRPFRLFRIAAVAAAVALVAAACAGGSDVAEVPPTTSAVTVAPATSAVAAPQAAPEPVVHPCDLDTADVEDGFCLVDGQWWFDAGADSWVESPGPPAPTTTAADATTDEQDATAADDEPVEAPRDEPLEAETATNDADPMQEPTVNDTDPMQEPTVNDTDPMQEPTVNDTDPMQEPTVNDTDPMQEPTVNDTDPMQEPTVNDTDPMQEPTVNDTDPMQEPTVNDTDPMQEPTVNDADPVEEPTVPDDVPTTTVPSGETTEPETQQPQPEATEDSTETPAAPEPQPEPEVVPIFAPSLAVDPVVVFEGSNTFNIEGSGFNPDLTIWLVLCALPGDSLSADTPADEIVAALKSIERSHCDLGTAQPMNVTSRGSFTAQRKARVIANFAWVATDIDETQAAGAAVFMAAPEPETPAALEPISEPLTRCATNRLGAGRVSVLAGTTADGFYEPVVTGGADSCERIMAWWDEIRLVEARRIADGQYPCEYAAAYDYYPIETRSNGPAMLVGCWPRVMLAGANGIADKDPDPAAEAKRLWNREGFWMMPPNHPAIVEAIFDCYRDALEGPPPGWTSPAGGEWTSVIFCNSILSSYGNPVRELGVTPECAAQQITGLVAERKARGFVGEEVQQGAGSYLIYAGDFSWANCSTSASRVLPEGLNTYSERCEAVIDASANPATDQLAEAGGVERDQVIAVVKAMFCDGTDQSVRDHADQYQAFVPDWLESYGIFVADWTPAEGSVCYEAAMLVAAQQGRHRAVDARPVLLNQGATHATCPPPEHGHRSDNKPRSGRRRSAPAPWGSRGPLQGVQPHIARHVVQGRRVDLRLADPDRSPGPRRAGQRLRPATPAHGWSPASLEAAVTVQAYTASHHIIV